MALFKSHSFEPRVGKAQKVFGIVYSAVAVIAVVLALYALSRGQDPYLQYFMVIVFVIMAAKSFFLASRIDKLVKNGADAVGVITEVTARRGITIVKAEIEVPDYGTISIEQRLAGMQAAADLNSYIDDNGPKVKAKIIGPGTSHPRGMLMLRTINGRLDRNSVGPQEEKESK